jgi:hypothetical protein
MKTQRRILSVLALIASIPSGGCLDGDCVTRGEEPGGEMNGTFSYTEADGQAVSAMVSGSVDISPNVFSLSSDGSTLSVPGQFVDASGATRTYLLTVNNLSSNETLSLIGNGTACFARQTNGQPVCSQLVGTLDIQALSSTCDDYGCAQTLQATLDATSYWEGTIFHLQLAFDETGVTSPSNDCITSGG